MKLFLRTEAVAVVNKLTRKGVEVYGKDMKEILSMMKIFLPYIHEPEKEISSTSLSSESD